MLGRSYGQLKNKSWLLTAVGTSGAKVESAPIQARFRFLRPSTHLGPSSPNLSSLLKLRVAIFTSTLDKTLKVGSGGIAALYTLLSPRGFFPFRYQ